MPNDHRQRRHTLWLLCALSFILYVDRVNLATAAGAIKAELGLSNTELGVAFSAFAYSYAICQIGGGWIADRFGARITLIGCGLIWVVSTFTTGAVHNLGLLFAARLLLGIGEGATLPARPRDHPLVPARTAWRRAGLHAFVLAARQRGHAADRRRADDLAVVARGVLRDRRGHAGVARMVDRRLPRTSARRRNRHRPYAHRPPAPPAGPTPWGRCSAGWRRPSSSTSATAGPRGCSSRGCRRSS